MVLSVLSATRCGSTRNAASNLAARVVDDFSLVRKMCRVAEGAPLSRERESTQRVGFCFFGVLWSVGLPVHIRGHSL
jgi:hypothetical protein